MSKHRARPEPSSSKPWTPSGQELPMRTDSALATVSITGNTREAIIEAFERSGAVVTEVAGPVDLLVGHGKETILVRLLRGQEEPGAAEEWRAFSERWTGKGGKVALVEGVAGVLQLLGYCRECHEDKAVPGYETCCDCTMTRIHGPRKPTQPATAA